MDLGDYLETGVRLDAELSPELAMTVFHPKTVLHDGGVIVKDGRLEGAACVFPVSQRELADRSLGLRHRAALGLAEQSDAIVLVVSEETGQLSIAYDGELQHNLDPDEFLDRLREILISDPENPMTDLLARDWKPLLLCVLLAVLVWFLVGERSGQTDMPPVLSPTGELSP